MPMTDAEAAIADQHARVAARLYRPEVGDEPYETYRFLRAEYPVVLDVSEHEDMYPHAKMGHGNRYFLSRFEDVHRVLRDPQTFSSQRRGTIPAEGQPSREEWRGNLIGDDPPRHSRIRSMVSGALTPRAIAQVGPQISTTAAAMLDALGDAEEFDVVPTLAVPLPVWMIALLLGVPHGDMDDFRRWAFAGARSHWQIWWAENRGQPLPGKDGAEAMEQERLAALEDFYAYFRAACEQRRTAPLEDLLTRLTQGQARLGDSAFSPEELLQVIHLMLLAGNETTANLITLVLRHATRDPDLWPRLRADRSLLPIAVEEMMRWDSPVQSIGRRCTVDTTIAGIDIPAESSLVLLLGAANRDENVWPDAEQFRLDRGQNQQLGFGHGVHFCMGASVTRLEIEILLGLMLDRYRSIEAAGPARLAGHADLGIVSESRRLRGYGTLPIRVVHA